MASALGEGQRLQPSTQNFKPLGTDQAHTLRPSRVAFSNPGAAAVAKPPPDGGDYNTNNINALYTKIYCQ